MLWWRRKRLDLEIAPEDIFLDSTNVSEFDRARFEGRIEKPLQASVYSGIAVVLIVILGGIALRSWNLQMTHGNAYAEQSERNSLEERVLFAPRGVITDRNGVVLAENAPGPDNALRRHYPYPELGQIIGYVTYPRKDAKGIYYSTVEEGKAGLEAQYNASLTGKNGRLLTETDVQGSVRSEGIIEPAQPGQTLRLSVDAKMVRSLGDAIRGLAIEHKFIAGAGVIMDVTNGSISAIVSYPSYDPNVMSQGTPAETIAGYNTSAGHPFLDHAVQGVYAPGSIVKPLVASGALTDGIITPNTIINDPGKITMQDPYTPGKTYVFRGWKELGPLDVRKAIAWSSDIFFYTVGGGFGSQKGLGIDRLAYWFQSFGLGTPTGIALPSEASGLVPTPDWKQKVLKESWYLGDTYFTSIGQYSVQVTPIQMVRAIGAVANGGKLYTPTLLADAPASFTQVPAASSALQVAREGMRECVVSALCQRLNLPYVSVAAKTGTAQTGSRNQYDNSWVVGFFPYDAPKYAFAVVLERGPEGAGSQGIAAMAQFFKTIYGPATEVASTTAMQ